MAGSTVLPLDWWKHFRRTVRVLRSTATDDFEHSKRIGFQFVGIRDDGTEHFDYRIRSTASGGVLSQDRLGGRHHRYDRAA